MTIQVLFTRISIGLCALLGAAAVTIAGGLDPESNTDGFDPAADLNRIGEARRLNAVSRQLGLTYLMQWQNPYFPGSPPVRQPIGYESKQVGPTRWIYRPVYSEDVLPTDQASEPLPAPAANRPKGKRPQRPGPADAQPDDLIPPQPAPGKNVREF